MTDTQTSASASEAPSEPLYNLFELRRDNFVAVSHAIGVLQGTDVDQSNLLAEAYITTVFHQAATGITINRTAAVACLGIGCGFNLSVGIQFGVRFINQHFDAQNILAQNFGIAALPMLAALTVFPLIASIGLFSYAQDHLKVVKNLGTQVNIDTGYTINPYVKGERKTYYRATRAIDALVAKAQRKELAAT